MKKHTKIYIAIIVLLIVFVGIFRATKQQGTLTLGLLLPLSGEYAVAGENYKKGVELALKQYKEQHPDTRIQIVTEDDGFDPKKGVSAYRKLMDIDKVDAIMMLSTPVIDVIHTDVVKTGIPVMQLGIQTIGMADDNIFQFSPSAEAPVQAFAEYLDATYSFSKIAVLYDNTAGGLVFFKSFQKGYTKTIVPMIVNAKGDLKGYATKIAREGYDAVIFLTSPSNGALTVQEILTLDNTPPLFGFDAQLQTGFADYGRILGDTNKLNGSKSMWLKAGNVDEFKKDFKDMYGEEPGFIADFGYDTFNVLVNTYDSSNTQWVKNIQDTKGEGASGPVSFDELGVRIQPIVINEIQAGKIVPIQ